MFCGGLWSRGDVKLVSLFDLLKVQSHTGVLLLLTGVFFFADPSQAYANTRLRKALKGEDGYHFKYSGDKYSFTIDTKGSMRIGPPLLSDSVSADLLQNNSLLLFFYTASKLKSGPDHHFLEHLQVKSKTNRSSFILQGVGQLENGYRYKMNISANGSQLILEIIHTFKKESPLRLRLKATRATTYQKGKVLINSTKGKKYNLTCGRVFDLKKYQRVDLDNVDFINRFPFNMKIKNHSKEGEFRFVQYSAEKGNPLNLSMALQYSEVPKKCKLQFSF